MEQIQVKNNPGLMPLLTFPVTSQGVIYSDLNFSVMLEWVTTMTPEPVLSWTLDGKLCGAGERLFIQRLSPQQLGYVARDRWRLRTEAGHSPIRLHSPLPDRGIPTRRPRGRSVGGRFSGNPSPASAPAVGDLGAGGGGAWIAVSRTGLARGAMPRPARLRLLLLLLLNCAPREAAETVAVQVSSKVTGFLGHSVTLLCSLRSEEQVTVTQVTWMKKTLDESFHTVAVFHSTKGPFVPEPERARLQFVAAKLGEALLNASLLISDLRAEDGGNYTCQFATFPMGSESAQVWLRVLAQPNNTAEALVVTPETPLDAPTEKPVDVAKCVSAGGLPPAQITWRTDLNGTAHQSQSSGPQPGTSTVTSLFSLVPSSRTDGKTLTCIVKHESFSEPDLLSVNLSLPYAPEVSISGYDDNWYLGRPNVALTCEVRSNPEPTEYDWSTITGALPLNAEPQGNRLQISSVDSSTNTTFICHVTNAVGSSEGEVTILVTERPESAESGTELSSTLTIVILILVIILVVVVVVVVVIVPRKCKKLKCCGQRQRPQPSENGTVYYESVKNQTSPETGHEVA